MGYRKLLKDYMRHILEVTGTDLVETGALTQAFSKRDLGELRSLAAELKRDSFEAGSTDPGPGNHNHMVRALIMRGEVNLEDLQTANGVEAGSPGETLTPEAFERILKGLLKA